MGEEAGRVNPKGFDIQNFGIADGKPTPIKYRAKACEKCSRYGERSRQCQTDHLQHS